MSEFHGNLVGDHDLVLGVIVLGFNWNTQLNVDTIHCSTSTYCLNFIMNGLKRHKLVTHQDGGMKILHSKMCLNALYTE